MVSFIQTTNLYSLNGHTQSPLQHKVHFWSVITHFIPLLQDRRSSQVFPSILFLYFAILQAWEPITERFICLRNRCSILFLTITLKRSHLLFEPVLKLEELFLLVFVAKRLRRTGRLHRRPFLSALSSRGLEIVDEVGLQDSFVHLTLGQGDVTSHDLVRRNT